MNFYKCLGQAFFKNPKVWSPFHTMIVKTSYVLSKHITDTIETFGVKDYVDHIRDITIAPYIPHFVIICEILGFSLVIY